MFFSAYNYFNDNKESDKDNSYISIKEINNHISAYYSYLIKKKFSPFNIIGEKKIIW